MDLSLSGQSRACRGAASCRPPRSWPLVGARVASPRCPILRPGDLSVAANTLIGQFPALGSGPTPGGCRRLLRPPVPVSVCVQPASRRHPRGVNWPLSAILGQAAATRRLLGSLLGIGRPRAARGRSEFRARPTQPRFFSSSSSIARYSRTRGRPQPRACAVCSGVSPSSRQWRTRSYWPR
jgi:hypothetical protein